MKKEKADRREIKYIVLCVKYIVLGGMLLALIAVCNNYRFKVKEKNLRGENRKREEFTRRK